jgi:hypothetical protein
MTLSPKLAALAITPAELALEVARGRVSYHPEPKHGNAVPDFSHATCRREDRRGTRPTPPLAECLAAPSKAAQRALDRYQAAQREG